MLVRPVRSDGAVPWNRAGWGGWGGGGGGGSRCVAVPQHWHNALEKLPPLDQYRHLSITQGKPLSHRAGKVLCGHPHPPTRTHTRVLQVLSASADSTARLWDLRSGQCTATLHNGFWVVRQAVFADTDSRRVVTGSYDSALRVFELRTLSVLTTLRGHNNSVCCCTVNGELVVSGGEDQTLRTWLLPP